MEGKESQKDILRLRQLEQAMHDNGSHATSSNDTQSSNFGNGYQHEAMVPGEN